MWKILSSMATFKEIKQNLTQKDNISNQSQIFEEQIEEKIEDENKFEYEEARYMLSLIARSDFKGQDIQIVYNLAVKLQNIIQNLKD
jgi:hypothetical protein